MVLTQLTNWTFGALREQLAAQVDDDWPFWRLLIRVRTSSVFVCFWVRGVHPVHRIEFLCWLARDAVPCTCRSGHHCRVMRDRCCNDRWSWSANPARQRGKNDSTLSESHDEGHHYTITSQQKELDETICERSTKCSNMDANHGWLILDNWWRQHKESTFRRRPTSLWTLTNSLGHIDICNLPIEHYCIEHCFLLLAVHYVDCMMSCLEV